MGNRAIIMLLFIVNSINIFSQRTNIDNEFLIKKISVKYDYSNMDNYTLQFEYDVSDTIIKMIHMFLNTKDEYVIGRDNFDLKEVKYNSFTLYKAKGNIWKKHNDKEKHYSFNKHDLLYKKFIYFNTIKRNMVYSFWYDTSWSNLFKMEYEITDAKDKENNYHSMTNFKWESGNLLSFHTNKDVDKKEKYPFSHKCNFIYGDVKNTTNIDLNYLFMDGDIKTNIEGCIGFFGKKMPNIIFYEQRVYSMSPCYYTVEYDMSGMINKIIYKVTETSRVRDYMIMTIDYEK